MRLVRLDDYPYGHPTAFQREWCYQHIAGIADIFNRHGIPFIVGVVPFEVNAQDCQVLRQVLGEHGRAVMHGFTHGFDFPKMLWNHIECTWKDGGEFMGMSEESIQRRYKMADIIMREEFKDKYDPAHFICPFNTYTGQLFNALLFKVKYIHTADEEYKLCGDYIPTEDVGHGVPMAVVSEHNKTYDWVDKVVDHLDNPSQITLHWSFDCQRFADSWWDKYETFAKRLVEHENAARVC